MRLEPLCIALGQWAKKGQPEGSGNYTACCVMSIMSLVADLGLRIYCKRSTDSVACQIKSYPRSDSAVLETESCGPLVRNLSRVSWSRILRREEWQRTKEHRRTLSSKSKCCGELYALSGFTHALETILSTEMEKGLFFNSSAKLTVDGCQLFRDW